jgi:predicted PurR-regulated permease PerM
MSLRAQVLFWLVTLLVVTGLLWLLQGILLPFLVGMAIAYFLDPVADRLEAWGLSRLAATALITIIFFAVLIVALVLLVPVIQAQVLGLIDTLPETLERGRRMLIHFGHTRWAGLLGPDHSGTALMGDISKWLGGLLGRAWAGGLALFNALSLFIITPIVAFYLLLDWDRMVARVDTWLPRGHAPTIRRLAGDINVVMAGFIRGQGMLMIFLALYYAIGLSLAGVRFGLLIGLVAGLISFMPFLGAIVGFIVAITVAAFQFWPAWGHIVAVVVIFLVGQFIEGNVLQPKLVGKHVGLHPVWVIFAVLAFGAVFGFVGMLLAVPLAAALGVVMRFLLDRYMDSPIYTGEEEPRVEVLPPPPARDDGPRRAVDL